MIQEHMWDEQIAREIQETTYGVEIKGAVLEFITGIYNTIDKIAMILIPFYGLTKLISNVVQSVSDSVDQRNMVEDALVAGNVGYQNIKQFKNLTTTGAALDIVQDYASQLSGITGIAGPNKQALDALKANWEFNTNPFGALYYSDNNTVSNNSASFRPSLTSKYTWGSISKSNADLFKRFAAFVGSSESFGASENTILPSRKSATEMARTAISNKFEQMLTDEYMKPFLQEGGYSEWAKSASKLGIVDISKAMESSGYNEADIKQRFEIQQAQEATKQKQAREKLEESVWESHLAHINYIESEFIPLVLINDYFKPSLSTINGIYSELIKDGDF
jgi:hypothetical protein